MSTDITKEPKTKLLPMDDLSSPYYLHHSDNPGAVIVSQPLRGDNYPTWSRAVLMALEAKNKLGFIDCSIPKPTDSTSAQQWTRCNSMVLSWLVNILSPEIANSVIYISTALEVWVELRDRFSQKNEPRIYEIRRLISNQKQGSSSVSSYYTNLKTLWDELSFYTSFPPCTCGAIKSHVDLQESEHLMQFLMGLNDSYSAVRSQILLMDPMPSVNRAYSLLLQEERQRSIHDAPSPKIEQIALFIANTTPKPKDRMTQKTSNGKKPFYHCDYCGLDGHSESRCFKKHGYPLRKENRPNDQRKFVAAVATDESSSTPPNFTNEQYNQLLALINSGNSTPLANLAGPTYEEDDWTG